MNTTPEQDLTLVDFYRFVLHGFTLTHRELIVRRVSETYLAMKGCRQACIVAYARIPSHDKLAERTAYFCGVVEWKYTCRVEVFVDQDMPIDDQIMCLAHEFGHLKDFEIIQPDRKPGGRERFLRELRANVYAERILRDAGYAYLIPKFRQQAYSCLRSYEFCWPNEYRELRNLQEAA